MEKDYNGYSLDELLMVIEQWIDVKINEQSEEDILKVVKRKLENSSIYKTDACLDKYLVKIEKILQRNEKKVEIADQLTQSGKISYDNIFELATIPEDVVKKNSILKKYINL